MAEFDNYKLVDNNRATKTFRALKTATGETVQAHVLVDADGNPISTSSRLPVSVAPRGSTGVDFSMNSASPGGVLLKTIPRNPNREFVEVQNQSDQQVQVVRDDGFGGQSTVILLAPAGDQPNQPGGGWSSNTFKGRLRIYADTDAAQVAAYED